MSGLIDKQAVIDLWDKYYPYISVKAAEFDCMLRALPPAQPEQCKDAVSKAKVLETYADLYDVFDDNKGIQHELHKVFDRINNLPSAQPEQRWIPCGERLPKNREWVLGIFQEGNTGWINPIPFICDYVGKKTPITTQDNWLLKMVDEPHPYYKELHCIAWMPLPALWKEGEADEAD